MTPELLAESFATVIAIAVTAGFGVYAKTRDGIVKIVSENKVIAEKDRDEWKLKCASARAEIHSLRSEWHNDRLELERLRMETNFAPLERKLDSFIERQTLVNESLSKNFEVITVLLGRLVPLMSVKEVYEQEQPL